MSQVRRYAYRPPTVEWSTDGKTWVNIEDHAIDLTLHQPNTEPAWPRVHLFRVPRRELALLAGAVGSAVLFERYGLSWSEGTLAAVPLVGGWVVSEVVG